jgi:ribosome-associated protein
MSTRESILDSIIEGIQDRKGEAITIADLTNIEDTICKYFVICQGGTPNQVLAITDSVRETVRINESRKPDFVDGTTYAHWVAMDYGEVMVHIFTPELRTYYDLEHLWADAKLEEIPDID